jgi:agmatinase
MSDYPPFLDLPEELTDPDTAAAVVLPVPYDATSTWKKGADRGPSALLRASGQVELYDLPSDSEPCRRGIATLEPLLCGEGPEQLADAVDDRVDAILARDQVPIVLGGEHSVSIGAIRAAARRFPRLSVLQLDAHADTREKYHGSAYNHACVMARARELCPIVQVGIRALEREEMDTLDRGRVFFAHEIVGRSDGEWMDRAVDLLTEDVYVTVDVDGFDPSLVPATGTPVPGGLEWYPVNELLRRVASTRRIVGFDVVELLPQPGDHGSEFLAAQLVYRMLAMALAGRD